MSNKVFMDFFNFICTQFWLILPVTLELIGIRRVDCCEKPNRPVVLIMWARRSKFL